MKPCIGRPTRRSVTPMKEKLRELGVEMTPALYRVAFEY